jgi:GNAT superfamily N-acetyltransferase
VQRQSLLLPSVPTGVRLQSVGLGSVLGPTLPLSILGRSTFSGVVPRHFSSRICGRMKTRPAPRPLTDITFHPLTQQNWSDLEVLFGPRGASGGCWCMWWKLRRSDYEKKKGAGNKRAFRQIVASGAPTGALAYLGGQTVGWCAVAPREAYPVLENSRALRRVDTQPVWSVTCFYIPRPWRRSGLTPQLLEAAFTFAGKQGAKIVEGYPVDPRSGTTPDPFAWTGLVSAFRQAGFKEVARRSPGRPIMRRMV